MIQAMRVYPQDLTQEDIKWLVLGCARSYDGGHASDQVRAAKEGWAGMHRLTGEVQGMFVLALKERQGKVGMEITCLAGQGLLRNFVRVHEVICLTARAAGAEFVMGFVSRKPLAEVYRKKTRAQEVASVFVEEFS